MGTAGDRDQVFAHRVLITLALGTLFVGVGWLLVAAPRVLLLTYAAILIAVGLAGTAATLERGLRLPRGVTVFAIVAGVVAALALGVRFAGPRLAQQASALGERLPEAIELVRDFLSSYAWGRAFLAELDGGSIDAGSLSTLLQGLSEPLVAAFGSTVSAITAMFLCSVMAIFLAIEPRAYTVPLLYLVESGRRRRVEEILFAIAAALRAWLLGRLISMAGIALLTIAGLIAIGVTEALALGLLAGLMSFIPYVGPVLAIVPAVLVTLTDGPSQVFWVVALYCGVQVVEGNLLTPLVERRTVSIPPAATLGGQLLMGTLFGFLGIVIATPLMVGTIVAVQGFYVEDVLGRHVALLGTDRTESGSQPDPEGDAPPANPVERATERRGTSERARGGALG